VYARVVGIMSSGGALLQYWKEITMVRSRKIMSSFVMSALAVALIGAGAAQAQTQTPAAPPSISAQAQQTMTDVSKWTRQQWHAARAKWREESAAWNGCQSQAKAQNLSGRQSWQFLYDCMTKS
jgi:hypothetical protein